MVASAARDSSAAEWPAIADADPDDPYKTLGVARDASQDDIRRAYRKLAKRHHPDLNPGDAAAEERFKIISAAHILLADPETRGQFDRGEIDAAGKERPPRPSYREYAEAESGRRYGHAGPQPEGWRTEDFDDVFDTMFGGGGRPHAGPRRGIDQHYALPADFLDALNGATRRLTLPDGRTLDVKIPPGTAEGQTLRLRGQGGEGGQAGERGDALIEIHVLPHPFFQRDGSDVRLILPVTLAEAVLGGSVEIPTPGGPVRMRVPAASDSGTELRLRGRGVPAHAGHSAGDLYATLRVMIGGPDPALEEFLRHWVPARPTDPRQAMEQGG